MNPTIIASVVVAVVAAFVFGSVSIIKQGHVGVATQFGRFSRVLHPGLNFRIPFVETIYKHLSLQHRSIELEFQAITSDQANVNFKALILFAVENDRIETIQKAAFRFVDDKSFMQALVRSVEGSVRAIVANRRQSEILRLRGEIVDEVKSHIDHELMDWGYHLINLQINDISFDEAILRSMAQVVASNNMKMAAENEAQAQYITKTRVAEAEATAKRAIAQAERDAEELKGQGNAMFRRNIALGLADAGKTLESGGVPAQFMLYTMWLDTMKRVAHESHGNILSFDGSMDGFEKTMRQMTALTKSQGNGIETH